LSRLDHRFDASDYDFPRLYVVGVDSSEYMAIDLDKQAYMILRRSSSLREPLVSAGLVPYESGWQLIFDPVDARVTRAFAVLIPWRDGEALYLAEGVRLELVEVSGVHVNLVAREGDEVGRRDVVAYTVTGKGETRTVRAGVEGLIVYIAWDPTSGAERYIYLVSDPGAPVILKPSIT